MLLASHLAREQTPAVLVLPVVAWVHSVVRTATAEAATDSVRRRPVATRAVALLMRKVLPAVSAWLVALPQASAQVAWAWELAWAWVPAVPHSTVRVRPAQALLQAQTLTVQEAQTLVRRHVPQRLLADQWLWVLAAELEAKASSVRPRRYRQSPVRWNGMAT